MCNGIHFTFPEIVPSNGGLGPTYNVALKAIQLDAIFTSLFRSWLAVCIILCDEVYFPLAWSGFDSGGKNTCIFALLVWTEEVDNNIPLPSLFWDWVWSSLIAGTSICNSQNRKHKIYNSNSVWNFFTVNKIWKNHNQTPIHSIHCVYGKYPIETNLF